MKYSVKIFLGLVIAFNTAFAVQDIADEDIADEATNSNLWDENTPAQVVVKTSRPAVAKSGRLSTVARWLVPGAILVIGAGAVAMRYSAAPQQEADESAQPRWDLDQLKWVEGFSTPKSIIKRPVQYVFGPIIELLRQVPEFHGHTVQLDKPQRYISSIFSFQKTDVTPDGGGSGDVFHYLMTIPDAELAGIDVKVKEKFTSSQILGSANRLIDEKDNLLNNWERYRTDLNKKLAGQGCTQSLHPAHNVLIRDKTWLDYARRQQQQYVQWKEGKNPNEIVSETENLFKDLLDIATRIDALNQGVENSFILSLEHPFNIFNIMHLAPVVNKLFFELRADFRNGYISANGLSDKQKVDVLQNFHQRVVEIIRDYGLDKPENRERAVPEFKSKASWW